jgi:hypothetical protein
MLQVLKGLTMKTIELLAANRRTLPVSMAKASTAEAAVYTLYPAASSRNLFEGGGIVIHTERFWRWIP